MDLGFKDFYDFCTEQAAPIVGNAISLINKPAIIMSATAVALAESQSSKYIPQNISYLKNMATASIVLLIGLKTFLPISCRRELLNGNLCLGFSLSHDYNPYESSKIILHSQRPVARFIRIIINETSKVAFDCSLGYLSAKVAKTYCASFTIPFAIVLSLALTQGSFYFFTILPRPYSIIEASMLF